MSRGGEERRGGLRLPPGYRLEDDPDFRLLKRPDGTLAAFVWMSAGEEEIERTAWEDYFEREERR